MKQCLALLFIALYLLARSQNISATVITTSASCFGSCNGSATVSATGGSVPYSFFWTPSGGTNTAASSLCAGNYSCIITDSDGRSATVIATVAQPPGMALTFTTAAQACNTLGSATVAASAGASPYSYSWSPGSYTGSTISGAPAGIYSLTVTDANSCSRVFTLSVPSVTTANFLTVTGPSTLCGNTSGIFSVSGGTAYLWSNNTTASVSSYYISNPASQYIATVAVTGTQAATGCTSTAYHSVQVYKPNLAITGQQTVCLYYPATLTATGADSYTWNGASTGSVLTIPSSSNAIYTVIGTDAFGCADTASHAISVIYSPAFTIGSGSVCSGTSFALNPVPTGSFVSSVASMTISTASGFSVLPFGTVAVTPFVSQQYSVVLQTPSTCISTVAVASVTVIPSPTLTAPVPSVCAGVQPTVNVSGANAYTTTNASANHIYVLGSNTAGCLSDTLHIYPTIYPTPTVTAMGGSICAGASLFIQTTGAATYSITGNSFSVSPGQSTTYTVTGTSSFGCASSLTPVTVTVVPIPQVAINSGSICSGALFTLVPSGASVYTVTGGSFAVSPTLTSSYSLTGHVNGCYATNTAVATVTVLPTPTLTVTPLSVKICRYESVTFQATGAASYYWNGIQGGSSYAYAPPASTICNVTGIDLNGCSDTVSIQVTVDGCLGMKENDQDLPATIFPNPGAGIVHVRCVLPVSLKVYDAEGKLLIQNLSVECNHLADLTSYGTGVYILELSGQGIVQRRKITVR